MKLHEALLSPRARPAPIQIARPVIRIEANVLMPHAPGTGRRRSP